jgi:hypothetical protein
MPNATLQDERWLRRWTWVLLASIAGSGVMAIVLIVWPSAPFMAAYNADYARVFYGAPMADATMRHHGFLLGVVGAGVLGWAVTLQFVVMGPWRRREPWAWWAVTTAVLTWVVVDLAVSLVHGVRAEALFAAVASVGLLGPCIGARRWFRPRG